MKKLIIDCSKPLGEQEAIVEITGQEKDDLLAKSVIAQQEADAPKPKTIEQRLAELENELATLKGQ